MKDIDSQCLELSEILKANFLTSQKRKLWPNKVKIMSRGYPLVNVFYAVNSFSVMTMQTLTCFYPFPLFSCFFIPSFSCQRSTSSISKMKQGFSKTVFKDSFCFLHRCFHLFFFMCNFFCKNLWFFFQGLMKNFNSCMKQSCSFSQDVLGWSEMTVQWRNGGNFNDNTNTQCFCDPGIKSTTLAGSKWRWLSSCQDFCLKS